ncbi:OLC1v1034386C1 [Oldenlandia corymbosa var. corymbosa]|uniref:OLC1v1034386C1 n=1 Tax=Oldenlandia corymbosa var. corymbosa TaxID=529605 RepID=A0AAV1CTM4_OLDCO|nr:OLC1v1034386C1 [Oldenlandia corymbosa var. corymbosa]
MAPQHFSNTIVFVAMLALFSAFAMLLLSSSATSTSPSPPPNNSGLLQKKVSDDPSVVLKQKFKKFMQDFGKNYTSKEEEDRRFKIFREALRDIEERNDSSLGINYFADFTDGEFTSYGSCIEIPEEALLAGDDERSYNQSDSLEIPDDHIPSAIDMRRPDLVTPVKDQERCGSCWAFATVAVVETYTAIKTDELISLSEQELVDCAGRARGCVEGSVVRALEFAKTNGIAAWSKYPYYGFQGSCGAPWHDSVAKIDRYERVLPANENALMRVVGGYGLPVVVNICANDTSFQRYTGGLIRSDCEPNETMSHSVAIVGYFTSPSSNVENYWIIKNSWGTGWGENGYGRIKMGLNLRKIASYAWLPVPN